ncbi:pectate lyase [Actinoplanes friuliensis DSM 7358]|uniref:Pectate lyase n=1 Tax=Actinoplanes friuliensis DSM 7358 TaxID=1246995 RepID=U5W407_9ACTN|nr:pectate lyase [Actinoplanes friuliensis DSM 7358]
MLLSDDFQDGNAAGWRTSGGRWSVADETFRQDSVSARATARTGDQSWSDYAVSVRVQPLAYRDSRSSAGVQARVQSDGSHYYLTTRADNKVELGRVVSGRTTVLATADYASALQFWRSLSLVVKGSQLIGVVNGTPLLNATDTRLTRGRAAVATNYATAAFDDVRVDGWTATSPDTQAPLAPGRPSVVEVTPTTVTLTWRPTIDNVGVVDYIVYQGEQFYQQIPVRTVTGTGPVTLPFSPTAASMQFSVAARDAAGNVSLVTDRTSVPQPPSYPKTGDDAVAPSAPGSPVLSGRTADGRGILTWTPATDNVAVREYHVILVTNIDEVRLLAKVSEPTATVTVNGSNPLVRVIAYDAAWNSASSPLVPYGPTPTPTPTA